MRCGSFIWLNLMDKFCELYFSCFKIQPVNASCNTKIAETEHVRKVCLTKRIYSNVVRTYIPRTFLHGLFISAYLNRCMNVYNIMLYIWYNVSYVTVYLRTLLQKIALEVSFLSSQNSNRLSSSLGLFCIRSVERDQIDWVLKMRLNYTQNAIGCTFFMEYSSSCIWIDLYIYICM